MDDKQFPKITLDKPLKDASPFLETPAPVPNPKKAVVDKALPPIQIPKFQAWNRLTQKAQEAGIPSNLNDYLADKAKKSPAMQLLASEVQKGLDWVGSDKPLLPAPPPPKTYSNDPNMSPTEVGVRTFFDEASKRAYDKILRPLTTPKNIALGAGMAVAPSAAVPYLTVTMATPMIVEGSKKAIEASKETDPMKRVELYSDAALSIGMGTLIGTKGGAELIKRVGEVPVVNAIKESVQNNKLITDESGFIHKDFLDIVNRWVDPERKSIYSDSKLLRTVEANDPKQLLKEARQTSNELQRVRSEHTGVTPSGEPSLEFANPSGRGASEMNRLIEPAPGQVRIDPSHGAQSYYAPATKSINSSPNLQTFWHEVGHFKNRIENGEIDPTVSNKLVREYISDHFLSNKSKSMRRIGDAILDDFASPEIVQKDFGSEGMGTVGQLRQELVADAYAWNRSVEHFGRESAEKYFRPQSTVDYVMTAKGQGAAAMRDALFTQQMRYRLDSELAANKHKLKTLQDQGQGDSPAAMSAQYAIKRLRTVKDMKSMAENPRLQGPDRPGLDLITGLEKRPYTKEVKPNTGRRDRIVDNFPPPKPLRSGV